MDTTYAATPTATLMDMRNSMARCIARDVVAGIPLLPDYTTAFARMEAELGQRAVTGVHP
jgi:hypothetical protein